MQLRILKLESLGEIILDHLGGSKYNHRVLVGGRQQEFDCSRREGSVTTNTEPGVIHPRTARVPQTWKR